MFAIVTGISSITVLADQYTGTIKNESGDDVEVNLRIPKAPMISYCLPSGFHLPKNQRQNFTCHGPSTLRVYKTGNPTEEGWIEKIPERNATYTIKPAVNNVYPVEKS
jgi:hypothetical protein